MSTVEASQHRYFIAVSYDGTHFHGSQIQENAATVQGALNGALQTILRNNEIETFGASRTDEGVHANYNVYHFDWPVALDKTLPYKLNAILPSTMACVGFYKTTIELNARFDAITRQYRYIIYNKKNPFLEKRAYFFPFQLSIEKLHETAALLKTHTDFESFCKRKSQNYTHLCTLHEAYWEEHGNELHFVVKANRFLRGMVRALVGTQLLVARNKISTEAFNHIILSKDCTQADFSVPGHGLYLEQINYPEGSLEEIVF
jgi:tRNA pseudouridine38-40 synthase